MPSTRLGAENTLVNKTTSFPLWNLLLMGKKENKQTGEYVSCQMVINDRKIRQRREMSHGEVVIVYKEGLTNKVTFEQRPERNE